MSLRLYDTRAQALRELVPLVPGRIGMYVCGPTVQSSPHIGHLRSALSYDIMRRWFRYRGFEVTLVRNVTDIDDKILNNAAAAQAEGSNEQWWALAYRYELEFAAVSRALGVLPPTYEPRATASILDIHKLIARLIEKGHAYPAGDGSGDVYFDVRSWPDYGALTHQSIDDMQDAADADPRAKHDPRDFALWKGRKDGEPLSASWESPWGPGRPGWHIECSAMAAHYLGAEFDIHGGGLDLRFPHHENELAQSNAAGDAFARYWVHNGLVNVNGQKMSKSLGNSIFARELVESASPLAVRYALASAHYRSTSDFTKASIPEAQAALSRIAGFLNRSADADEWMVKGVTPGKDVVAHVKATSDDGGTGLGPVPDAFAEAMDDDLGVPNALAVLHTTVGAGNAALDARDFGSVPIIRAWVKAMTGVLGIDPEAPEWAAVASDSGQARALDALVTGLLTQRQAAREAKDYATSDRIRDELAGAGIVIEDTPDGVRWGVNPSAGSPGAEAEASTDVEAAGGNDGR